ncbi:hypothetical protein FRC01_003170 [Tulasnella sp. 417]|nr:hypothetical protein FRC01_003170 [Tulasnella sp. 417]
MGSHHSRHDGTDGLVRWPHHPKHRQPRQSAAQNLSAASTPSFLNLSTAAFNLIEDLRSPTIQTAPTPSPVPRLNVLRSDPSTVSLQSRESRDSTHSFRGLGRLLRPNSNRSAGSGGRSLGQHPPSPRPGTPSSGFPNKRKAVASPGAGINSATAQHSKASGSGRIKDRGEGSRIDVQVPDNKRGRKRDRLMQAVDAVASRLYWTPSPTRYSPDELPPFRGHAPPPIFVSPPTPAPLNTLNRTQFVPYATPVHAPVMGQVPRLEHEGSDPTVKPAFHLVPPSTVTRRPSFLRKIDRALKHRSRTYAGSCASSVRSVVSVNSLFTLAAPSVSSFTTDQGTEASPPLKKRSLSNPQLKPGISLDELRDGLLSGRGERSAKLDALDCTRRLKERTAPRGSGGYSDVWQAKLDGRLVAVKALRSTQTDRPDEIRMKKRLGRELHVWAALRHPHVLELLGFAFVDNARPCLISPWCKYGTLQDYLKIYRNPDRPTLVRQVAEGLGYLHSRSPPVIHGDFKTMNILVTEDHVAKICDFGGSKHLGEEKTGFTTAGLPFGTVRYSAPEISRDDAPQTLQSDVYSFGYVALETMTSKYPFWKVKNDSAVIHKVGWEGQTPSKEDYSELEDEELWMILRRCWNNEPSARPTMIEVCRTLAAAGYGPSHSFYVTECL